MQRRRLLQGAALAAASAGLAACGRRGQGTATGAAGGPAQTWKMVTSWPANFPGLGTGATRLAELITAASGGRLTVKVYGAGELAGAFEVFDLVSRGTAQMGHSASYYWKGKAPAAPFFSAVPFGLNAQEMNGWLQLGGGIELWRELYAPFGLIPFAAGNTGVQMAGWFRNPVRSLADLQGLKMRIPGLGGEVMARLGATPVNLPGGEIFTALQSGLIDAAEWVGPYNDLAFGFHRITRHCYTPGWQEPGPTLECMVNRSAYEALPADLQAIVSTCCEAVNQSMLAEYAARNQQAMDVLANEHGVQFGPLPADVVEALKAAAQQVLDELAASDPMARKAWDSLRAFREQARRWNAVSERAYLDTRG
jgi:TRAP-type mannitol/chloroaromatic compound transport system substrate-binding protein